MKSTGISGGPTADPPSDAYPPPLPQVLAWQELAQAWAHLPAATRRAAARSCGRTLHALWTDRVDLARLPPALWTLEVDGARPRAFPPPLDRPTLALCLTSTQVLAVLARWYEEGRAFASFRDQAAFLGAFFGGEAIDRHGLRHAMKEIALHTRRTAAYAAAAVYRGHARERDPGLAAAGRWLDPAVTPDDLLAALRRAEADPATTVIKETPSSLILRARLFGRDALVKRHDLTRPRDRVRYWFRASRARRAWCAARTLRDLGIDTAEPLGYLDVGGGRAPACSYLVTAFLPDAVSVREWIRRRYARAAPGERRAFRRQLAAFFLELLRRGVYHADTKALNMLIEHPDDPERRRLLWIDLDGVRAGHLPTRYQVLRNLVQLNGSVRSWVPEEDRFDFLRLVAREYPWLSHPRIARRIRARTRRRLLKEVRSRCGP